MHHSVWGTSVLVRALAVVLALWGASTAATVEAQCIDEAIRDELNARRRYRGVQERLFQKAGRHELSVMGGAYAADLLSSSYLASGAYTYHFTEDLGLEASFAYTRAESDLVRIVEEELGATLVEIEHPVFIYQGNLLWSLAYGKLRWFGSRISRFDFFLVAGAGVTDNRTARGLTFNAGLGFKFFPKKWLGVRIDVRDHVLTQDLLGQATVVNNVLLTLGLSTFMPFNF